MVVLQCEVMPEMLLWPVVVYWPMVVLQCEVIPKMLPWTVVVSTG